MGVVLREQHAQLLGPRQVVLDQCVADTIGAAREAIDRVQGQAKPERFIASRARQLEKNVTEWLVGDEQDAIAITPRATE